MTTYVESSTRPGGPMGSRGYGTQGAWAIHRSDCGKIARKTWGLTEIQPRDVGWALMQYLRDGDGVRVCSCARGRD